MRLLLISISSIIFILVSIQKKEAYIVPENWPKPHYNFAKNPYKQLKVEIGRALFYDPILSADSTISCASCHSPYSSFTHTDHALSHGVNDRVGTRNSPVLINLAWQNAFMWDGAINHLDVQALAPMHSENEMNSDINTIILQLRNSEVYRSKFQEVFQDSIISSERILKSLSQFMLTLVSENSKYDKVMRKEAEFNGQEKRGHSIFLKHCASCHTEPLFTNYSFKNNGLDVDKNLND